jgi:hypothetical protein
MKAILLLLTLVQIKINGLRRILLGSMAMMAFVFFFINKSIDRKWRTSVLVRTYYFITRSTLFYMRDWFANMESITFFRYVDWLLTVPL